MVVVPEYDRLLLSGNELRAHALRALPYIAGLENVEDKVVAAVADSDSEVAAAGAVAAGRMRVARALPVLQERLHRETKPERETPGSEGSWANFVLAATWALAQMDPEGTKVLEDTVVSARDSLTGASALEMLEKAQLGRLSFVTV